MKLTFSRSKRGFTLIELLIVVAIIAILAAIAVPNFLCAQTRSKYSRVLSEFRTMRTAVESYAVDWNKPPRMSWGCQVAGLNTAPGDRYQGDPIYGTLGPWITTPVSYITRFDFFDPFQKAKEGTVEWDAILYTYQDYFTNSLSLCPPSGRDIYVPGSADLNEFAYNFGSYFMLSIGPTSNDYLVKADFYNQYDPSNGCVSNGTIFVSQKHTDPVLYESVGSGSILR
ncbi:prepilin-type N-terminal cleavage/methylation domain-containing protein [bacterium]|nr:prepilin-type N-terminal cleavage/methylation domain-containing protein [bacterium]